MIAFERVKGILPHLGFYFLPGDSDVRVGARRGEEKRSYMIFIAVAVERKTKKKGGGGRFNYSQDLICM
jgi:hypothetical protein